jgi:hypothetical protein
VAYLGAEYTNFLRTSFTQSVNMIEIQAETKYILTNSLIGSTKGLASTSVNDSVVVVPLDSNDSQSWYFLETPTKGYYRLHTQQKGDFAALDVYNYNGKNTIDLHMFAVHEATGQYWYLNNQDDGSVKINNQFTGPDMYLDIVRDTLQPTLAAKDGPGQRCTYSSSPRALRRTLTPTLRDTQSSRIITDCNTVGCTKCHCICYERYHDACRYFGHRYRLSNRRRGWFVVERLVEESYWRHRRRIGCRYDSRGYWRIPHMEEKKSEVSACSTGPSTDQ